MKHRTVIAAFVGLGIVLWLLSASLALLFWDRSLGSWLWVWGLVCLGCMGALGLVSARAVAHHRVAMLGRAREALVFRALRRTYSAIRREQTPGRVAQLTCETLTADGAYEAAGLVLLGRNGTARTWAESGFGEPFTTWLALQADDDLAVSIREATATPSGEPLRVARRGDAESWDSTVAVGFQRDDGGAGMLLVRGAPQDGSPAPWETDLLREAGREVLEALCEKTSDARLRRDAEAALGESQRTLATLLSNLPGMAYRCFDDERRTMLFLSEGARRLTGYGPEDLTNNVLLSYADLILPEDRDFVHDTVERALAHGTSFELNYRLQTAAGEIRWVWEQGQRIRAAEDGWEVLEGLVLDISESVRIAAEREALLEQVQVQAARLQEKAAQLQQIVASVPEGVLLLDEDYRVVLANPPAEQVLKVLGTTLTDTGRLLRLGDHALADLLASPRSQGMWHEVHAGQRVFSTITKPVEYGPVVEGWVVVLNEVTQERETLLRTQQQERLAAVGQLAAGIAHDFNNVLAVVVLYSQMAMQVPNLSPRVREYLKVIGREAGRGGDLIQQILDFGRRGLFNPVALDLAHFLEEQGVLLRHTLPATILVDLHYEAGAYMVRADPARLRQAIINLALNARDAMGDEGTLTIALGRATADGQRGGLLSEMQVLEWIRVEITDTGCGIPPELMPRLFEPFFTTKGSGGNGLGLAQVHGIVGQHDGTIGVTSMPGKGTTFTVYLPALVAPSSAGGAGGEPPRGEGEVLLLVEDHETARRTLANALDYQGYRVLTVRSGLEALAVLDARGLAGDIPEGGPPQGETEEVQRIALIMCDLTLPDIEGAALLRALREREGSVPIIGLVDHPAQIALDALHADGLVGWLPTPPRLDELSAMVARVLGKA